MDAVAGARRTPGRHKTGGVPPKPPATTLLSLLPPVFWASVRCSGRCGVTRASCCGSGNQVLSQTLRRLVRSPVLHFVTDSRMFWVFGSLFQRRCGAPLASGCGSGNVQLFRRCGVCSACCCGSGNLSSIYLFWTIAFFSSQMIRHPHGSGCCDINTFIGCPNIRNYNQDVLFAPVVWLRNRRSCTFQHSVVTLGRQYDQFQPSCDVTTYTFDSSAVASRCVVSRASGEKLKLRMRSQTRVLHEMRTPLNPKAWTPRFMKPKAWTLRVSLKSSLDRVAQKLTGAFDGRV